jgi:transcription termination factor Rho
MAVDRSDLEKKDRNDLVRIAEALGDKVPSRAKKADIIDRIIKLVPGDEGEAAASDEAAADAKPATKAAKDAPKAKADAKPEQDAGTPAGESDATDEPADAAAPAAAEGRRGGGRQQGGGQPDGGQNGSNGAKADAGKGDAPKGGQQGGGQQDQGQQANQQSKNGGGKDPNQATPNPGGQGNPNQAPPQRQEDGDGNRRRRRRGRQGGGGGDDEFQGEPVEVAGLLDLRDEGYGFLRLSGYLPSRDDVYVSVKQVRQFALRKGDRVEGASRPATRNEKNPALLRIDLVNGVAPDQARTRPRFEDLTPLFPDSKINLEMRGAQSEMTTRVIDLIAPIGKGQRGLIVSPPKAGKTTVMKQVARAIEVNHPEIKLIVLLVDERPEEVTDMKRWLLRGEVAASTFDRPSEEHTQVSELVIERAKRMVEEGQDVVIMLDGITRLARAYNLSVPPSGRIMSGGIDAAALYPPKKFFGAARNVEEGGSLTILATALVETNSRMDDHIFEEFKGTGNMELKLDRKAADRRIFPAIDVEASSTRHEELLFDRKQLTQVWTLRRVLSGMNADGGSNLAGLELLIDRMQSFKSNEEFLAEIGKASNAL